MLGGRPCWLRDATVIDGILRSAEVDAQITPFADLLGGIGSASFSAAVIAEEALAGIPAALVADAIGCQPPWSDFPCIVLTRRGRTGPNNPILHALRNVTEVERPVHPATLLGTVQSALRARTRQHETAAHLAARHEAEISSGRSRRRWRRVSTSARRSCGMPICACNTR